MGGDVVNKVGDQCLERDRITENRKDVEEIDALVQLENQEHEKNDMEDMPAWGNLGIY